MVDELRIHLLEEGADSTRLATLANYLRSELLRLDVEDVRSLPASPPPPGARAFGVAGVGGLVIALGQSADSLRSVVTAIRDWLGRGHGEVRTIRLEIGGDVLELAQASAAEQEQLIQLFVQRHTLGSAAP